MRIADPTRPQRESRPRTVDAQPVRLLVVLAAVFVLMSVLSPDKFFSLNTLKSMGYQVPEFGIYSIAMMFAMVAGGIDLSIVSVGNLSGLLAARFLAEAMAPGSGREHSLPLLVCGILIALGVGLLCGLFNGFAIAVIGIPPILATLASMQIFNGVSTAMTAGAAVVNLPEGFAVIGNWALFQVIPLPLMLFAAVAAVLGVLQSRTRFGMELTMVGANRKVAQFSGISCTGVLLRSYAISGVLAALAGLVLASRSMSAKVGYGEIYQLQAILAVVLGGTSPSGGHGRMSGVVMAVLSLQILSTGLNILRISNTTYTKNLMWGALLLGVMVANLALDRRRERKLAALARGPADKEDESGG